MNDHLTSAERTAYWQRQLEPERLLEVSDHLQECAACREELLRARPVRTSAAGVSYEELVGCLEGNLDPLAQHEIAERMRDSPPAAAELTDLRHFDQEMNALPSRDYSLLDEATPSRSSWILPLAAGLALGLGFLWLSTAQHDRGGIALLDGGKQILLRRNGSVPALGSLPADLQVDLQRAASSGKVPLPAVISDLGGTKEVLAGAPPAADTFAVLSPLGTVVENPQPILRWQRAKEATGYRVNLVKKNGGEVVTSPLLPATENKWTSPQSLQPNETYEWEVEALRDKELIAKAPAPPEPEARFAVLPNEKRMDLEKLRAKFGHSHLVMGLAYAKAGLIAEARSEFEQLADENPGRQLPKQLRASLATTER